MRPRRHGIDDRVGLCHIVAGQMAAALLEPVIDELPAQALLDDGAIDGQRRTRRGGTSVSAVGPRDTSQPPRRNADLRRVDAAAMVCES